MTLHLSNRRHRFASALALVLGTVSPLGAQSGGSAAPRAVTLITGDTVLVSADDATSVLVQRGPGRDGLAIMTRQLTVPGARAKHLFVIPEDAAPLIASGKVDRRLFDVTRLLEYGYDDARRDSLPLIVTYEGGPALAATQRAVPGAVVGRALSSVNGVSVVSPKASARELWAAVASPPVPGAAARAGASGPIAKLWLDGLMHPVLDRSVPQIGAPEAWAAGYDGDGVLVAVLDTGVDDTHPDLADRVIASRNFTLDPDADSIGHGTHVASIIAGTGAASGGAHRGVAPGAELLAGKVCEGLYCPESSVIAGMQWAVAEEGALVVNLSLGGEDTPGYDPVEEAVSTLTAQYGALFVVAAGNTGPFAGSIESPGAIAAALTVGATERDDQVAFFSSRGPTRDLALKPDLTAPGVDIVAARAAGTELGALVGDDYATASGTSMATPHVAGAAALLLQRHPIWGAAELKSALIGSAAYHPAFSTLDQGGGRVDVAAALEATLLANVPSLSLGVARWPHEDDVPLTRTVTLRNTGASVQLTLELDVVGPDGAAPPSDMFRVEPSTLLLPEGGSASLRVSVDTRLGSADGVYSGRLVASDGAGAGLAIPLAVERERESYDLVLRHLDRQGQPSTLFNTFLTGFEPFVDLLVTDQPGQDEQRFRLPKGRYIAETLIFDPNGVEPWTLISNPNLLLDADSELELDARTAAPVELAIAIPAAAAHSTTLSYVVPIGDGGLWSSIGFTLGTPAYYSRRMDPPEPALVALLQPLWQDASTSPPSLYTAAWTRRGDLPEGRFEVELDRLARVRRHYAASLGTELPFNELYTMPFLFEVNASASALRVQFPYERVEHIFTADEEVQWLSGFWAHDEGFTQSYLLDGPLSRYRARRTYQARFNEPMFQSVVPELVTFVPWVYRAGDQLAIYPPAYGDSAGNTGWTQTEGRTRLYRDGELIGENPSGEGGLFEVPPEPAEYRFELDTAQALFELTTEQRLVWTFRSARPAEGVSELPPLLKVRFAPDLDARGRAPRGRFRLPFEVARYGGGPAEVSPHVEVSYDEGLTWATAEVRRRGQRFEALLEHPRGAAYVSLRAQASDADGNGVEHTVIRAYALERRALEGAGAGEAPP